MRSYSWILFLILVINAHLIMPLFGKNNIGPFYNWQLFTGISKNLQYDMYLEKDGGQFYITSGFDYYLPHYLGIFLYQATRDINNEYLLEDDERMKLKKALKTVLDDHGAKFLGFCKFKGTLIDHVLRTPEEKRKNCETVMGTL